MRSFGIAACAKVLEPSELRFGVVRGVSRDIGVLDLDGGSTSCKGKGRFWDFVFDFHCWIFYWVADEEMFSIRL